VSIFGLKELGKFMHLSSLNVLDFLLDSCILLLLLGVLSSDTLFSSGFLLPLSILKIGFVSEYYYYPLSDIILDALFKIASSLKDCFL